MTLNIFFLTVTIRKREMSVDEARQNQMVQKLYEEHKDRAISLYRIL